MRGWWVVIGVLAASCQGETSGSAVRQAIVGGSLDTTSNNVFIIDMQFDNGDTGLCTATLISARSLLTAAHCVDPARVGAANVTMRASNKADANVLNPGDFVEVVDRRLHPSWQWSGSDMPRPSDVAVLLLASAPAQVTPAVINRAALSNFTGKPIRLVGYGRTSAADSQSSAVRRQVTLNVTGQDASYINFGVAGSQGTCVGDSGGPAFHTFSDGVTRQVGVLSGGNSQCGEASDVRVDIHAGFIDQWLTDKEPPTCGADGRCQTGCMPVDADCAANFGACTSNEQCAERHCVDDAQSTRRYCTTGCLMPTDCPNNAQCMAGLCMLTQRPTGFLGDTCTPGLTLCEAGAVCSGLQGSATTCRPACLALDTCAEGSQCVDGEGNTRFCYAGAAAMPDAGQASPVTGGCTQAGVSIGWFSWLGLLSLAKSRRRLC